MGVWLIRWMLSLPLCWSFLLPIALLPLNCALIHHVCSEGRPQLNLTLSSLCCSYPEQEQEKSSNNDTIQRIRHIPICLYQLLLPCVSCRLMSDIPLYVAVLVCIPSSLLRSAWIWSIGTVTKQAKGTNRDRPSEAEADWVSALALAEASLRQLKVSSHSIKGQHIHITLFYLSHP